MSSSPRPTPTPQPAVVKPDELSSIRPSRTDTPFTGLGDAGDKALRLAQKLRIAAIVLADLPPHDARQRLLQIAIVRRDEVLLDGLLASLEINQGAGGPEPNPAQASPTGEVHGTATNQSGTYEAGGGR